MNWKNVAMRMLRSLVCWVVERFKIWRDSPKRVFRSLDNEDLVRERSTLLFSYIFEFKTSWEQSPLLTWVLRSAVYLSINWLAVSVKARIWTWILRRATCYRRFDLSVQQSKWPRLWDPCQRISSKCWLTPSRLLISIEILYVAAFLLRSWGLNPLYKQSSWPAKAFQ